MTRCKATKSKPGEHDWQYVMNDRRLGFGMGRRITFVCDCGAYKQVPAQKVA